MRLTERDHDMKNSSSPKRAVRRTGVRCICPDCGQEAARHGNSGFCTNMQCKTTLFMLPSHPQKRWIGSAHPEQPEA